MRVKDIYKDAEGNWHIDYGFDNMVGLAFRNYIGTAIIQGAVMIPVLLLFFAAGMFSMMENPDQPEQPAPIEAPYQDGEPIG